jgi:hypothetical protein
VPPAGRRGPLGGQVARGDELFPAESRREHLDPFARDVRQRELGLRQLIREHVRLADRDLNAVATRVLAGCGDRVGIYVERGHGPETELRGGHGQHARAAAQIEHTRRRSLEQELEAEPSGRVRAGTEGQAWVDHHRDRVRIGLLPRRPEPQPTHPHGPVEALPRLLPTGLDFCGSSWAEDLPEPLFGSWSRVGRQLEVCFVVDLLEPLRKELEHDRPGLLGPGDWHAHGETAELRVAQRNAARSFSKKPPSAL